MPFYPDDFGKSPDEILFNVKDMEVARAAMLQKGVNITETHEPGPGIKVASFEDPDGRIVVIESREILSGELSGGCITIPCKNKPQIFVSPVSSRSCKCKEYV